ncbi:Lrp/AsnC ligand binding domain-containing protein [soil metagenome]
MVPGVITSIVLLHVDVARIPETATALAGIASVSEVYSVTGDWELVAMVRVRTHDEIAEVVTNQIAKVEGITGTHTMIAFRAYASHDLERLWGVGFDDAEGI